MKTLDELQKMWEEFGNIPINEKEQIVFNFYSWPAGTEREDIWHWFDENCPNNLYNDLMFPKE